MWLQSLCWTMGRLNSMLLLLFLFSTGYGYAQDFQPDTTGFYKVISLNNHHKLTNLLVLNRDSQVVNLDNQLNELNVFVFWATWCESCKKEFPFLKKAAPIWAKKGISIFYFSIDDIFSTWKQVDKKLSLPPNSFFQYSEETNRLFWLTIFHTKEELDDIIFTRVPVFSIVDKKGNIIIRDAQKPSKNLEKQILKLKTKR